MKIGTKASLLLIDAVNEENAGNYTCRVSNFAGSVEYTASLDVYGDCFLKLHHYQLMWLILFFLKHSYNMSCFF